MQSATILPFNTWKQGLEDAVQLFLKQIRERVLAADTIQTSSLLISYVPNPSSSLDIEWQAQHLGRYFRIAGMQVSCVPLSDEHSLAQNLQKHRFALILCTPAYAKKVDEDPAIRSCLDRFGQTRQKNALYPLLCKGGFNDTALKIVDRHFLIREYQEVLKPDPDSDPLRPLETFVDIFLMLSGQQGLGILPAMLLKEKQQVEAEILYREALDSLKATQAQLTIDYRLSCALKNDVESHAFKPYMPSIFPVIQQNQDPGFGSVLDSFLPSKAKISLLLCATTADVHLSNLALIEVLQTKGLRVLSIDCVRYAGRASKDCVRLAARALKLRKLEDLKSKPLVILLKGYEALGVYDNLYVQNQLACWPQLKVIVTCRADFFAHRGYLRCFLSESSDRRVESLAVYKVPAFASLEAQKAMIPLMPFEEVPIPNESLSPTQIAQETELRSFLSRLKDTWIEEGWLSTSVVQNSQVFISYAWEKDAALKRQQGHLSRLAEGLRTLGLRPWLDTEQMTGNIPEQMETNIAQSTLAVVVGSPRYLERSKPLEKGEKTNVQKEYEAILLQEIQGNLRILPMLFLGNDQNAAFPPALRNRATCVDFRGVDKGEEYLEQMSHPHQGLISRLLEIGIEPERLKLYEQCYAAFKKELKLLVGKHLVLAINQATLGSLEVTHRLKAYLKPFALVQEHLPLSDRFDLGIRLNAFLERPQAKTFVALGHAGSGKSLFALDIFRDLMEDWQSYKHSGSSRPQWLPLYIPLRNHNQNPESCIQEALRQQFQLSQTDIQALRQGLGHQQQLLFICDGYDELGAGRRPNLSQQLADWPYAKLLMTARPEHFDTTHGVEQCLAPAEGFLDLVYLSPFVDKEIQRFVLQYEQGQGTDTYHTLQKLPGMMALVNNPFLLSLVLKSLPQLLRDRQTHKPVSRTDIYEAFIKTWFKQETEGRELRIEDCQAFSEALAFELFKANTLSPSPSYSALWAFFEDEAKAACRDAAPLRYSAGEYTFIHKSLYEYFSAQHLWKSLSISKNFDTLWDTYPLLKQSGILEFLLDKLLHDALPNWVSDKKVALSLSEFLLKIGDVFQELGKYAEAQAAFQGSLSILEDQCDLQESSELVCILIIRLGNATCFLGDPARAKGLYERALAIQERTYGEDDVVIASTLTNLGIVLRDLGDPVGAKRLHERALALKERTYGKEHIEVAATLTNLGAALRDLGKGAEARVTLKRALAIKEHTYGVAHIQVASTLVNLANVLLILGELLEAKKLYERALLIKEGAYGVEHVEVASTLTNLSEALRVLGDAAGAKAMLERALAIQQRIYGTEHIAITNTLGSLANTLTILGDVAGAKAIYERVLAIQQGIYGVEHVAVGVTLANLGSAFAALGDSKEAKRLYERALVIQEQTYGLEHVEVAATLSNLGNVLGVLGELARSKVVLERALVIQERTYGLEHIEVASTLVNMANTCLSLGHIIEARGLCERILAIQERIHGGQHAKIASILSNLGNVLGILGEPARSKVVLERALAIQQRIYGLEHAEVASTLTTLGNALSALGNPIEATRLYERALVIQEHIYGVDHVKVAPILTNLGNALRVLGDPMRSRLVLERALVIQERTYGLEHAEVATTLMNLGIALGVLGKPIEAKKYHERALAIQERVCGAEHVQVANSLMNLGDTLRVLGDPVGAKKLLERALRIQERTYGSTHAEIAPTLMGLGNALSGLGDSVGAKRFYERALVIQERTYGLEHVELAPMLGNLGGVLHALGKSVEAKKLYERALAIKERTYGVAHVAVAPTLTSLGAVLQTLKDVAGAKALYERALPILENHYGKEHPEVAVTLMNLGTALYASGDAMSARVFLKRALAILECHYAQDHAYVCAAVANLRTVENHLCRDADRNVSIVDKRFAYLENRKITNLKKLIKILDQCKTKQDGEQWPTPELALRRAAATGSLEKVKALVEIVEDLDVQESGRQSKKTALDFADFYGHLEVVQFLQSIIEKCEAFEKSQLEIASGKVKSSGGLSLGDVERQALSEDVRNSMGSGMLSFSKKIGGVSDLVSNDLNTSLNQKAETMEAEGSNRCQIEERKRFSMS